MRLLLEIREQFANAMRAFLERREEHSRGPEAAVSNTVKKIDERLTAHGLPLDLPEIVRLKTELPTILSKGMEEQVDWLISTIDPNENVTVYHGAIVVRERMFGGLLKPWTIAQYHAKRDLAQECTLIKVDKSGTHLFGQRLEELVRFEAGVCDPHRLADPGNRLENAALIVRHYTGFPLKAFHLRGMYSAVVAREADGKWSLMASDDPYTA